MMSQDQNPDWVATDTDSIETQLPEPTYEFIVPGGTRPGDSLLISGPRNALAVQVVVPPNVWPGARLVFSLPDCFDWQEGMSAFEVAADVVQSVQSVGAWSPLSWMGR